MKKSAVILLSSIAGLSVGSGSAFSDAPTPNVYTGGTGATTDLVRIYQPTRSQPPVDAAEENRVTIVNNTTVFYTPHVREYETRAERRKRAIGHRYLGFIKQYRGYKYPF